MAENLPAIPTPGAVSRDLAALPVAARSAARKQALDYSEGVLERMNEIAVRGTNEKNSVAAGKVVLAVAALLSSTNIPRDIIKEKLELTRDLSERYVPEHSLDEFLEQMGQIWGDV